MGERNMSVAHLSQKGQILVPKQLRRKLGLKPGAKVHLAEEEGRLVLTPVPADPIEAATGFLKGRFSLTQDLRRERREEARRERKARAR
jgi:AbrB family looped-hinge helix DNA binding protein